MSEILIINDQSVSITDDEQMQKLEEELQAKVLIRTVDDENDSDYEDVDDDDEVEKVPIVKKDDDNQNVPKEKLVEKNQELADDDNNNAQSPAYVPRKGKFYEHDDRTSDDNHRTKPDISRNKSRIDDKWQHDLFFQDQKQKKSRQMHNQFQLNDYMSRTNHRMTNFDFPKQQIDERAFHRRRNFTNSQYQQQDYPIKSSKDNLHSKTHQTNRNFEKYELNTNQRNSFANLQSNFERPKRYSTMRNNSSQQQASNSNAKQQNEWPQAPPLPSTTTTSFLSQQLITPQMFYQQQTSRYVSLNYPQTSITDQFQASK